MTWKDEKEVWAVGGGGSMFVSKDGGKTFTFNKSADDIPGNLYKVRHFSRVVWCVASALAPSTVVGLVWFMWVFWRADVSCLRVSTTSQVKFFGDKGFVLGSEGILLRYRGNA